jgi:predicted MPP superfamily phosphohydrolase
LDFFWVVLARTVFFGTLLALLYFSQRFWFRSVWRLLARVRHPGLRRLLRAAALAAAVLVVVLVLAWMLGMRGVLFPRSTYALLGMWLSSALFAWLAVKLVHGLEWTWHRLVALGQRWSPVELADPGRRYFFQTAAFLAGATPFVGALYGFAAERLRYRIERVDVPIPELPEALDGFRILQLSDIHIGTYLPAEQLRRAVAMANELEPHLAVVTGDFLTSAADPLEDCIAELAALRAPLGLWGCNGNHEIYARAEDRATALFARVGGRILRQESAELVWRGLPLNLIGVDYQRTRPPLGHWPPMLAGVERLVHPARFNILLSHNPNAFPRAAELGIELTLAGHTHGGQVQVEILDSRISPARFITEFIAGLYQRPLPSGTSAVGAAAALPGEGAPRRLASLYVNRGLGTVGAPVRLGVPPEITLLVLRRAG